MGRKMHTVIEITGVPTLHTRQRLTNSDGNMQSHTRATGLQNGNKIAMCISVTKTMGDK